MDESTDDQSIPKANRSCTPCQHRKKKCDKRLPQCSLCRHYRRKCTYDHRLDSSLSVESDLSSSKPLLKNEFPNVYFLDYPLFNRSIGHLSAREAVLDDELINFVGTHSDVKEAAATYFSHVHPWIPILSKQVFFERLWSPLSKPLQETIFLSAAMKLLAYAPKDGDPSNDTYRTLKRSLYEVEMVGSFNLRVLQSLLLVAVYEVGHGIYPAAYLSVGHCARYGSALGINDTVKPVYSIMSNLSATEEERRSWWAIVLLDRYLHLGCPDRMLATEDPSTDSILPISDKLWEEGILPLTAPQMLGSPPTEGMGRFGLTVQAAMLLGKALKAVRDKDSTLFESDIQMLDATLKALTRVSYDEGLTRVVGVCSPTTICYSARLLLNMHRLNVLQSLQSTNHPTAKALTLSNIQDPEFISEVTRQMLYLADSLLNTGLCGSEETSPFCLDSMYRCAMMHFQRYTTTGDEKDLENQGQMKMALRIMGRRWSVADTYLEMMEAREMTGIF